MGHVLSDDMTSARSLSPGACRCRRCAASLLWKGGRSRTRLLCTLIPSRCTLN